MYIVHCTLFSTLCTGGNYLQIKYTLYNMYVLILLEWSGLYLYVEFEGFY